FFFQAEDGIRDFHVTGVQTCALPICALLYGKPIEYTQVIVIITVWGFIVSAPLRQICRWLWRRPFKILIPVALIIAYVVALAWQIGRASCRERVWVSVEE